MALYLTFPDKTAGLKITFEAGHRVWRVRLLMILSLIFCIGGLFAAYHVILAPFEGEAVSSIERFTLASLCSIPVLLWVIGMDIYARCYVVRIERQPGDNFYIYTTPNWIGYRQALISTDEQGELRHHRGKWSLPMNSNEVITPNVDAPYNSLKFRNRKLPFILDDAGVYFK